MKYVVNITGHFNSVGSEIMELTDTLDIVMNCSRG